VNPFLRHNGGRGEFYRVSDVHVRDGKLQTGDGTELKPTEPFATEPVKPTEPLHRDRLERRPTADSSESP
jgi:hypothetical protein